MPVLAFSKTYWNSLVNGIFLLPRNSYESCPRNNLTQMPNILENATRTFPKLGKLRNWVKTHFKTKHLENCLLYRKCNESSSRSSQCLKIYALLKELRKKLFPQKTKPKEYCYLPQSAKKIN